MFSPENLTKSTLLCGPPILTKPLMFEAAIHWAEEGHRVIYITPAPIESMPATYHDRHSLSAAAFKPMRFMYLPNYEILVEQLVTLHTFAALPSVLLIDNLDAYIHDFAPRDQLDVHIARLCAIIQDSTNACSRILKTPVHLCVSTSSKNIAKSFHPMYFNTVWYLRILSANDGSQNIELSQGRKDDLEDDARKVYNYQKLADRTLILKQISQRFVSYN